MSQPDIKPKPSYFRRPFLFAGLLLLLSCALVAGGAQLVGLGGSPYYLLAGIATFGSGLLVLPPA